MVAKRVKDSPRWVHFQMALCHAIHVYNYAKIILGITRFPKYFLVQLLLVEKNHLEVQF